MLHIWSLPRQAEDGHHGRHPAALHDADVGDGAAIPGTFRDVDLTDQQVVTKRERR